jgi:hypothetical protein
MTRKDYVTLAAALLNARPAGYSRKREAVANPADCAWLAAVCNVADSLGKDNARFDNARFLSACGV